jgi:SAM-dependent methyltransferase
MAESYAHRAPAAWATRRIEWGVWNVPESKLRVLGPVSGLDVVELGCGTACFSSWLARRGARPVGVDVTPAQLATARAMQERFAIRFPLVEANAELVPLADGTFDLALSEYGASIWCDPYRWVPEAARLLRPGGRLIFLRNASLLMLTVDDQDTDHGTHLVRDYFGLYRIEWPDDGSVEFHLGYGDWIRILVGNGLQVEDLVEIQAPADAPKIPHYDVDPAWARRWPSEEIWVTRKTGDGRTTGRGRLRSGARRSARH